jgi:hypothetical protein
MEAEVEAWIASRERVPSDKYARPIAPIGCGVARSSRCHGKGAPPCGGGAPKEPPSATGANQVGLRFVFDACANGQQLKCLTVIDKYTREVPAIGVAGALARAA